MSSELAKLPHDLRSAVMAELQPGERVLYAGRPHILANWGRLVVEFVFGLGWMSISGPMALFVWSESLGIPIVGAGKGMGQGFAIFFSLFVIPFVGIGLAMLAAPFWQYARARRTVHAVTDQRLVNIFAGRKREVESFKPQTINFVKRQDRGKGSGSLQIGYGVEKDCDGDTRPLTTEWPGIADAKRAEGAIRQIAKWAR